MGTSSTEKGKLQTPTLGGRTTFLVDDVLFFTFISYSTFTHLSFLYVRISHN